MAFFKDFAEKHPKAAQCINFPLQRNITFRSHGSIPPQIVGYFFGWVGVTLVVNSINSVWVGVAGFYLQYYHNGSDRRCVHGDLLCCE